MVRDRVGGLIIATDTFFHSEMGRLGSPAIIVWERDGHLHSVAPVAPPKRALRFFCTVA
jgi:hypothetical protein